MDAVSPFTSPEHLRVLPGPEASIQVTLWKCHQSACCGDPLGTQSCFLHRKLDRLHHSHRSQGLKYSLPPGLPCQQLVFSYANTGAEWVCHVLLLNQGSWTFIRDEPELTHPQGRCTTDWQRVAQEVEQLSLQVSPSSSCLSLPSPSSHLTGTSSSYGMDKAPRVSR